MTGKSDLEVDVHFLNAMIFDGTGAPPFLGNVAVSGDRIAAVDKSDRASRIKAIRTIDVGGSALAPGFIDAHTHDDRAVIDDPGMIQKLSQGVTTVVTGNCGISLAPVTFDRDPPAPMNLLGGTEAYEFPTMGAYADRLSKARPSVNVVALVGHSALRLGSMRDISKPASADEIAAMRGKAFECMADGASGFSTGLFYPTNSAADPKEVAAIGSAISDSEGVYTTHMRDEGVNVLRSIDETTSTARAARLPLVISHHKCAGVQNWGRTRETLPVIELAAHTQPVNFDVYPYAAGSTNLREDLVTSDIRIMISWSKPHPETVGRNLQSVADDWGVSIYEAARRLGPAGAIYFQMREDDVRRVLQSELSMIGSDGLPHDTHPHPRLWGTFPRVLGHYARELGLFSMETAIWKMTGLPAEIFGLRGRGRIAEGYAADLVQFNPATIIDRATYSSPTLPAAGIELVAVNGSAAFENGKATGAGTGKLLKGRRKWNAD